MEDIKRILVVSRSTKDCRKVVHYGISLSQKYGAEFRVIHVVPAEVNGYIQSVYNDALLRLARDRKTVLRMERGIGAFVQSHP